MGKDQVVYLAGTRGWPRSRQCIGTTLQQEHQESCPSSFPVEKPFGLDIPTPPSYTLAHALVIAHATGYFIPRKKK